MDKDFMEYVYARKEKALAENAEYTELQRKHEEAGHDIMLQNSEYEDLTIQIEDMGQELCYLKGFNDAMQLLINSNGRGQN